MKKQSRLDVRKYSFSQRTINVWNKLSTDCVHASSVNMFKNKIDNYLAKGPSINSNVNHNPNNVRIGSDPLPPPLNLNSQNIEIKGIGKAKPHF